MKERPFPRIEHFVRSVTESISNLSLVLKKDQDDGDNANINTSGVSTRHLVDLQRFLACDMVLKKRHLTNPDVCNELKIVVANSKAYTPQTNLLFRSNTRLRSVGCEKYIRGRRQII